MPYNELIKDISRIRDYLREFFVYGFKSREEVGGKSARSYDNERRRIESWLGECMSFRQDAGGRSVFISVDSRRVPRNPLYQAWKAKSFTKNDITLHFWLLDILSPNDPMSLANIIGIFDRNYLPLFENADPVDESTIRKKLKEYVDLGIILSEKQGKQLVYCLPADDINLQSWQEAIVFFAEENPLGAVGSFIRDKFAFLPGYFSFKHNYLLFAPDSGIMLGLLSAMREHRRVELEIHPGKRRVVLPLKIFISTQGGRQYAACCNMRTRKITFLRLDSIQKVKPLEPVPDVDIYTQLLIDHQKHLWGVSTGQENRMEHIEMTLEIEADAQYIAWRLERERRCGTIEQLSETLWRFTADVYDAQEMLPWLRTFTGRIVSLTCSNRAVERRFYADLTAMAALYGGDRDAV